MSKRYISPYEAYPFLRESGTNLLCDYELATDHLASGTGLLRALVLAKLDKVDQETETRSIYLALPDELLWLTEMIYHLNASLRTTFTVSDAEFTHLLNMTNRINELYREDIKRFLLPAGSVSAMQAHLLRVDAKSLVRLLYRQIEAGHPVDHRIIDWANLLSGFYFMCSILINDVEEGESIPFVSRNY